MDSASAQDWIIKRSPFKFTAVVSRGSLVLPGRPTIFPWFIQSPAFLDEWPFHSFFFLLKPLLKPIPHPHSQLRTLLYISLRKKKQEKIPSTCLPTCLPICQLLHLCNIAFPVLQLNYFAFAFCCCCCYAFSWVIIIVFLWPHIRCMISTSGKFLSWFLSLIWKRVIIKGRINN